MSKFDSVYDKCAEEELEFDVVFDQEDSLIDTVAGVNENGDPVTGAEGTDEVEVEDNSVKGDLNKDSEADKFVEDSEKEYHEEDDSDKGVDPECVTNTIEKEIDSEVDIDDILSDESLEETVTGADKDVEDVADMDDEQEYDDIDDVLSDDAEDPDLQYDLSDEDLIDIAINGGTI